LAEVNGNRTQQHNTNPAKKLQQMAIVGGAESGAVSARVALSDPDLTAVVNAWPTLPDALKAGILAMIRATGGRK
jgi:hypothetical protein